MADRWILSWGLGAVSFGGASLLVPLYIVRLGATPFQLGLLAAVAAFVGAPGALLFGRLAGRVSNRRGLVLLTLTTTAITLAGVPFLDSIGAVILANAVLWFVVASVGPVVTMLVVSGTAESDWSTRIAALNKAYGYGWAGGLLLGTIVPIAGAGLFDVATAERVLFGLFAAIAGAATLLAWRTLPGSALEGPPTARQARRIAGLLGSSARGIRGATFVASTNRLFWSARGLRLDRARDRFDVPLYRFLLAAGLFFGGFGVFWAPLPHLLSAVGFDSGSIFALYLLSSLAGAVLYDWTGRVATRYDESWLTAGALSVRGLCFPLVAIGAGLGATALGTVVLGGLLLAVGMSWAVIAVVGTTIVTRLAPPDARSEALGSYAAIGALAGGVGSVLGGWLATVGYRPAFGAAGALVLLGAALLLTVRP